jgi:hypothetical protein
MLFGRSIRSGAERASATFLGDSLHCGSDGPGERHTPSKISVRAAGDEPGPNDPENAPGNAIKEARPVRARLL